MLLLYYPGTCDWLSDKLCTILILNDQEGKWRKGRGILFDKLTIRTQHLKHSLHFTNLCRQVRQQNKRIQSNGGRIISIGTQAESDVITTSDIKEHAGILWQPGTGMAWKAKKES